jgi:hypothetical protein
MALAHTVTARSVSVTKTKSLENDGEKNLGVKLIPLKDSQVTLTAEDALVVVAEDDL